MSDPVRKTIVVNSWDESQLKVAHEEAHRVFGERVSPVISSPYNGYQTFVVAGVASKDDRDEYWDEDTENRSYGDFVRKNTPYVDYLEVTFAANGLRPCVTQHNSQ